MNETVKLNVGSIDKMGKCFIGAWRQLERGEDVYETNLTFFDLNQLVFTLSPKLLALLRRVHAHPAKSVSGLAKTLAGDYKRVHEDVSVLEHAGLLVQDDRLIKAFYDHVQANVSLVI
jgi:predicted transcriptional regulator